MYRIKLAEIVFEIDNRYPFSKTRAQEFLSDEKPDVRIHVTDEEVRKLCREYAYMSEEEAEESLIYTSICKRLPEFQAFVLHAAVISLDREAYIFSAPSGVGKSTHIALWREKFGERVSVLNGDKPILRLIDGQIYAFGSPWKGKENWGNNGFAKVKAICFLEQAAENSIRSMETKEVIEEIFQQIFLAPDAVNLARQMELIEDILLKIPFYKLNCNMQLEAAEISYRGMTGT